MFGRHSLFFTAALLSVLLVGGYPGLLVANSDMHRVSTRSELLRLLPDLRGGATVLLAPGHYGVLDLSGIQFARPVTLRSANPANPAKVDRIDLTSSRKFKLEALHIDNARDGDAGSKLVRIVDAEGIDIVGSRINASIDGSTDYTAYQGHFGVYVKNSKQITLDGNTIHDVRDGITVISGKEVRITENRFDFLGHDTIKIIATHGILIENNTGPTHVFAAPNAHKDFIQFGGGDSSDIVIRGNVFIAGNNPNVQGIFMDDASFRNVLIEDNLIYTGMLRGISITAGSNITVRDNTILNIPDAGAKATVISVPPGSIVDNNIQSGAYGSNPGTNIVAQHTDPIGLNYYGHLFVNAYAGRGATIGDFAPIPGSPAMQKGANLR